jgi:mannose-6-phosphate isomerase-like protein (cupin superfamily)
MKSKKLRLIKGFRVALGNRRAQVSEMVLDRGETEGGPETRHRGSDQWMYGLEGTGLAIVNGRRRKLTPRTMVLIERGDTHEICNTGRGPLRTIDF